MEVRLNVARDNAPQSPNQVVHLSRRSATNGISNTHAVDTDLVHRAVQRQEVDQIRPERVFRREADLQTLGLDELDDLEGGLDDVVHILAMAVFPQVLGSADDDVEAVNTSLDGEPGVAHVAADMGQNLGLEAEIADLLAVIVRLLGRGGRGQLDVVDAEGIEGLGAVEERSDVSQGSEN